MTQNQPPRIALRIIGCLALSIISAVVGLGFTYAAVVETQTRPVVRFQ